MITDAVQDLNPLDRIDREKWSNAIGMIMASLQPEFIHACAAAGYDEFQRVAHPILAGHALKQEDYKRIYAYIVRKARSLPHAPILRR